MSVIEASSVGVKTMADGTLRITLDIEPRNAQAAFALFGSPGTPAAIAALVCESHTAAQAQVADQPKGGPLAKLAGTWCASLDFQEWANVTTEQEAAEYVRDKCGIKSRSELDNDENAASFFHALIRHPYRMWLVENRGHEPKG